MRRLDDIRDYYRITYDLNDTTPTDREFGIRFQHYRWMMLRILRLEKALMYYANFLEEQPLMLPKMSSIAEYGFGTIARDILAEDL